MVKELVMERSTYLIVGGGMTADAAARGIRDIDGSGTILLVGAEHDPPYKRPLLSKGLWKGKPLDRIWSGTERHGVDLRLGRTVKWLDLKTKIAVDDRGDSYSFDKLLLATGSRPKTLSLGDQRMIFFRSLQDYHRLRALVDQGQRQRFAVVGGGFIGSEIAASLASNGQEVTMIFPGMGIGDRMFPADLARSLTDLYREQGVAFLAGAEVIGLEEKGDELTVRTREVATGREQETVVDGIVAGIGTEPNSELAAAAGLAVDGGIVVDQFLRTSHPDVYAAGDVAAFWHQALGKRMRVEHEDNAKTMGRHAGRAMAGEPAAYHHIPFFYSDLFELGYEAVGEIDAQLETVADWKTPYREGVIYYRRDAQVRGVLLWNVWDQVAAARTLIGSREHARSDALIGRLPSAA